MFETQNEGVRQQYELLSILDSKASALLTFNAVALTALTVWLGYVSLNYLHLVLDVVFLLMLVSCAFLLGIIALRWARVEEDVASLERTRIARTRRYRRAWWMSISGVVVLVVVSIIHTVGTALIASDNCNETCQAFFSDEGFGNFDFSE